jgi:hypothetical protein
MRAVLLGEGGKLARGGWQWGVLPTHALIDFEIGGWLEPGGVERRCLIGLGWRVRRATRGYEARWIDWLTNRFEGETERGKGPVDPCPVERVHQGWCAPGSPAEQDCEAQAARDREALRHETDDTPIGAALRAEQVKDFVRSEPRARPRGRHPARGVRKAASPGVKKVFARKLSRPWQ